ncbi:MAG TPA: histidine phosphatase family protein [Bacilli bacterium]|nr:histidine phosphatase family protein [Bacilli bacterium]
MIEIYLVRHAHSEFVPGQEVERGLSVRGFADAERVTAALAKEDIEAVAASHYKRAIQTVQGVADALETEVVIVEEFRERELGEVEVASAEEHQLAVKRLFDEPTLAYPEGESNAETLARGLEGLRNLLTAYAGKKVAVGTHGNTMVVLMQHFDPQFDFAFWQELGMPDVYKLRFEGESYLDATRVLL